MSEANTEFIQATFIQCSLHINASITNDPFKYFIPAGYFAD